MPDNANKTIEPLVLARQQAHLSGSVPLALMLRLTENGINQDGEVSYNLQFGRNQQGKAYVDGSIEGEVVLNCQRCLKKMPFALKSKVKLYISLQDKEVDKQDSEYEYLATHGEPVSLVTLIEDELLLSLPIVPMHDTDSCHAGNPVMLTDNKNSNPFKGLENIEFNK